MIFTQCNRYSLTPQFLPLNRGIGAADLWNRFALITRPVILLDADWRRRVIAAI